jgi:hypothetical protein
VPPGEESGLVGGVTRRAFRIGELIRREDVAAK